MDGELDRIVQIMGGVHGLDVAAYDPSFLMTSIKKRGLSNHGDTLRAYGERLTRDRAEAEALFASLSICHSEFFRDPLTLALLEALILSALVEKRKRCGEGEIRVWSAACAAGQEAYSVAILLDDLANAFQSEVPYRIFATDVSEASLATGREGRYPADALQNVPLKYVERCFTRRGDVYEVVARLKDRVDFSYFDLISAPMACPPVSIFGDFDLAFCSNLLLYYREETRRTILKKIYECLATDGYLVTGEAEKAIVEHTGAFHPAAPPAAIFKKK
jgi:chemotaxis methyl-accepting protein methylase